MTPLLLESYFWIVFVGGLMRFGSIRAVHDRVTYSKATSPKRGQQKACDHLLRSMDIACALYPKRVLCLQRSAATLFLLRRHGWDATLVIGAQTVPFKSHAWVELNGAVVSDKPYMREMYQVLELL